MQTAPVSNFGIFFSPLRSGRNERRPINNAGCRNALLRRIAGEVQFRGFLQTARYSGKTGTLLKISSNPRDETSNSIRPNCASFATSHRTITEIPHGCESSNFRSASFSDPSHPNRRMRKDAQDYQDSAFHRNPVEKTSPATFTFPFILLISDAGLDSIGRSRAIGFPCLVTINPWGSR